MTGYNTFSSFFQESIYLLGEKRKERLYSNANYFLIKRCSFLMIFYSSLLQKTTCLVLSRAQGFTTLPLCCCSHARAELAADSARSSCFLHHCYTRGTIFPLFWSDGCAALSEQAVVPHTTGPLLTGAEQVKHARLGLALFEDKQA